MRRPGFAGRRAAGLRDGPAELAEQERQAADDVGPVQGGRAVPQRGQRVEMNQAVAEDGRLAG